MKFFSKNFIDAINTLKKNDSQTVIASNIGMRPQSLSQIMKEKRAPTVDNISKLFTVYGINPIWLLTGKGEMIKSDNTHDINQSIEGSQNYMAGRNLSTKESDSHLMIEQIQQRMTEKDNIIKDLIKQQKKLIDKL